MKREEPTNEIDLVEVANLVWAGRKLVVIVTASCVFFGTIWAFTGKDEYTASVKFLSESSTGPSGLSGGLAGLAGINLNLDGRSTLSPEIYPEIVNSIHFQSEIIYQLVYFESIDSLLSPYTYFTKIYSPSFISKLAEYTIGLPRKLYGIFTQQGNANKQSSLRASTVLNFSKADYQLIKEFKSRIRIEVDTETGIVVLSVEMPEPSAAAHLTQKIMYTLQDRVISYKINKATESLKFINERYNDAKTRFANVQEKRAALMDKNKNISTASAQIQLQIVQNEYDVAFEVFRDLSSQLERAEIRVKEETPVFSVIEPAIVPMEKSGASKSFILIFSIISGTVISIVFLLVKGSIKRFVEDIKFN